MYLSDIMLEKLWQLWIEAIFFWVFNFWRLYARVLVFSTVPLETCGLLTPYCSRQDCVCVELKLEQDKCDMAVKNNFTRWQAAKRLHPTLKTGNNRFLPPQRSFGENNGVLKWPKSFRSANFMNFDFIKRGE